MGRAGEVAQSPLSIAEPNASLADRIRPRGVCKSWIRELPIVIVKNSVESAEASARRLPLPHWGEDMTEDSARHRQRSMPDLLLVEDNPLHLRLVKSMLADIWPPNEVAEVRHARSLEEAVAQIAAKPPACVLLDLVLPDADGMDSLIGVRTADPLVPIVVLSSHENATMARNAIEAGAQDYLVKGAVSPENLERSVAFAMGRKDHERRKVAETPGLTPWPNESSLDSVEASNPARAAIATPPPAAQPAPTEDNASIGVAVVSTDGSILFMEPRVASSVGRSVDELAATPAEQFIHPNDLTDWRKLVSGDPGPADIRYLHPSGHPIFLRVTARQVAASDDDEGALVMSFSARGELGTASSGAYVVMTDWG